MTADWAVAYPGTCPQPFTRLVQSGLHTGLCTSIRPLELAVFTWALQPSLGPHGQDWMLAQAMTSPWTFRGSEKDDDDLVAHSFNPKCKHTQAASPGRREQDI